MSPSMFAVCGLIAGMAAHITWSEYKNRPGAPAVDGPATAAASICTPDPQRMRVEVRRAVREAVRGDRPNPLAEALLTGVLLAPTTGPETEENRQAREQKTALIDAAIRAGRWTDDDVTRLRAILPGLSASDRPNALLEVSQAIDERRFKFEASVPF